MSKLGGLSQGPPGPTRSRNPVPPEGVSQGVVVRLLLACAALVAAPLGAGSTLRGELPRAEGRPLEEIPGVDSAYDALTMRDGVRLRTILTRPAGSEGPLPAIYFAQWLSCDSVELPAEAADGWSRMLRRLAQESGWAMGRTEKRGVGDSAGGPCAALDYETELADHREALARLRESPLIDRDRVVVFGASMGGTMAPLLAAGGEVAGVVVWGGGANTWFERTLGFERRRRELSGAPVSRLDAEMTRVADFLTEYLIRGRAPQEIAAADPELGSVWSELLGTEGATHYGRPVAFHQQAQRQAWAAAWERVRAPVLVLYGEHDWFEEAAGHALIATIANRRSPGSARFEVIPGMDHHFAVYPTPEAAFAEEGGKVEEGPVVDAIVRWLRELP